MRQKCTPNYFSLNSSRAVLRIALGCGEPSYLKLKRPQVPSSGRSELPNAKLQMPFARRTGSLCRASRIAERLRRLLRFCRTNASLALYTVFCIKYCYIPRFGSEAKPIQSVCNALVTSKKRLVTRDLTIPLQFTIWVAAQFPVYEPMEGNRPREFEKIFNIHLHFFSGLLSVNDCAVLHERFRADNPSRGFARVGESDSRAARNGVSSLG